MSYVVPIAMNLTNAQQTFNECGICLFPSRWSEKCRKWGKDFYLRPGKSWLPLQLFFTKLTITEQPNFVKLTFAGQISVKNGLTEFRVKIGRRFFAYPSNPERLIKTSRGEPFKK
jgi:hypothetical protein